MLRGVRRGCVRGDFRCGQFWVVLQVIGDELDDYAGCNNRRLEGGAVTKRMPGAPVLKSSLIGARRVAGGALLEEGRYRFSSFVGETTGSSSHDGGSTRGVRVSMLGTV